MEIILNNRKETIEGGPMTVNELIKVRNFTFRMLITKVNGQLVRVDDRDNVMVNDGDKVDVLHLISGG